MNEKKILAGLKFGVDAFGLCCSQRWSAFVGDETDWLDPAQHNKGCRVAALIRHVHATLPREPDPDAGTVEVRIPVAVYGDGAWSSVGVTNEDTREKALGRTMRHCPHARGYLFIVARCRLPKITEVVGAVEETESEPPGNVGEG